MDKTELERGYKRFLGLSEEQKKNEKSERRLRYSIKRAVKKYLERRGVEPKSKHGEKFKNEILCYIPDAIKELNSDLADLEEKKNEKNR